MKRPSVPAFTVVSTKVLCSSWFRGRASDSLFALHPRLAGSPSHGRHSAICATLQPLVSIVCCRIGELQFYYVLFSSRSSWMQINLSHSGSEPSRLAQVPHAVRYSRSLLRLLSKPTKGSSLIGWVMKRQLGNELSDVCFRSRVFVLPLSRERPFLLLDI